VRLSASITRFEDEALHHGLVLALEIQQVAQSRWIGHVQVVARDEPKPATAGEQIPEMRDQQASPAFHDERHGDVDGAGVVDVADQMREQRILAACN